MIKSGLIFIASILLTFNVHSQDRATKPKATFSPTTVGVLTTATGWMLNPDDEWLSLKNTIPLPVKSEYKTLISYEKKGLGTDNFKYYQLRELTYKGKVYSVLIKQYRDGYYEYSTIEEGWVSLISHTAYVFNKSELDKLNHLTDSSVNLVEINIIDKIDLRFTKGTDILNLITQKVNFNKPKKKYFPDPQLILHIAPYKSKDLVQFQIYDMVKATSTYGRDEIKGIIKEYYFSDRSYGTPIIFKKFYYEVDYTTFTKFLDIKFTKKSTTIKSTSTTADTTSTKVKKVKVNRSPGGRRR